MITTLKKYIHNYNKSTRSTVFAIFMRCIQQRCPYIKQYLNNSFSITYVSMFAFEGYVSYLFLAVCCSG